MIRLMIPTNHASPDAARALRWHNAVREVRTYVVADKPVLLVWETDSPEVAYVQLGRLAAAMIGGYQLFSEAEELAHVNALGAQHVAA